MNTFTVIFLIALGLSYAVHYWLSQRQASHVLKHRDKVPEAFAASIPLEAHQKAADYTLAKNRLGNIDSFAGLIFLLVLTLGSGISWAFDLWNSFGLGPIATGTGAIATVFLIMHVLELPFSIYQTFVIEQHYGFNRSTPQQFLKDQLLQLALLAALGLPILALLLWLMDSLGSLWWLWAWVVLMGFSLLMSWLFPTVIAPLFNKFTPLEEGPLKDKINRLLERCGFSSKGIFIMDGSRRSGHGNAYFTGLGNNKRIVFFDTLVQTLEEDELEAVLAHELGHFKCKHTIKMLIATSVMTLISMAVLGWLIDKPWFYSGLGVDTQSNAAALLLFMLVSPAFTAFLQPISSYVQRRYEFEADAFASQYAQASKLISGLVKLYRDNASTLTPDPLYSAFHYSHPPAAIRIEHLQRTATPSPSGRGLG